LKQLSQRIAPDKGVIKMRTDLFTGVLFGVVLGLMFTAHLAPHLPVLVIVALILGTKIISLK
jgi:F0F1-type ATP synthase assembly protein I